MEQMQQYTGEDGITIPIREFTFEEWKKEGEIQHRYRLMYAEEYTDKDATGSKYRSILRQSERQKIINELESRYEAEVQRAFEVKRNAFQKRYNKHPDKIFLKRELDLWDWTFYPENWDGLQMPLLVSELNQRQRSQHEAARRVYFNLGELRPLRVLTGRDAPIDVDPAHVESMHRYYEWLKELQLLQQEQPKGDTDTSTTPQESKDGTGAENEPKVVLTYNLNDTERKELFAELMRYEKDSLSLTELLNGKPVLHRITVTCQQNEFAEVFKRLKYNGKIVQPVRDIVQWLSENFAKSDKGNFNRRSIEDLFKPSGTPPKNRLCDFDWLTFKDEIALAREAHEVKMKKY